MTDSDRSFALPIETLEDADASTRAGIDANADVAQQELPLAFVHGKPFTTLPRDLYIPPEALEVFLEAFEGPLDLLLYLIRRQNLDILQINVAEITEQYMRYVELMDAMQFELAAEYLVMSAMLAEIKSRMLLPRQEEGSEDETDPRADLIRRLQEYEQFKQAAEDLDALPRLDRDVYLAAAEPPDIRRVRTQPHVDTRELLLAFSEVMRRVALQGSHHVQLERLSTRERMSQILMRLQSAQFVPFLSLFRVEEGRMGVVVSFLAVMELIKEALVDIVQSEPFGPIHVRQRSQHAVEVDN